MTPSKKLSIMKSQAPLTIETLEATQSKKPTNNRRVTRARHKAGSTDNTETFNNNKTIKSETAKDLPKEKIQTHQRQPKVATAARKRRAVKVEPKYKEDPSDPSSVEDDVDSIAEPPKVKRKRNRSRQAVRVKAPAHSSDTKRKADPVPDAMSMAMKMDIVQAEQSESMASTRKSGDGSASSEAGPSKPLDDTDSDSNDGDWEEVVGKHIQE